MHIKEVMKPARTIDKDSSVKQTALLMKQYHIGSVIVTNSKKVVGIVTERDILEKVTAENKLSSKIKTKDIMTSKLISIEPGALLDDAAYLMIKHKIKKIPVIQDGDLLGIITTTEIVTNSDETGQFYFFD